MVWRFNGHVSKKKKIKSLFTFYNWKMIIILNKIGVITTYGKFLYESINNEVVMKKIGDRYTNNIFDNIKHIDDYENEYWYAREL